MAKTIEDYGLSSDLEELLTGLQRYAQQLPKIIIAGKICAEAINSGGTIYFCGNGGSAADAQHWSAELTGRFLQTRPAMRAMALTVDTSALTAIGNDFGFDQIFSRQIEGMAREGDVLIAMSTSGTSVNVVNAAKMMKGLGGKVISLVGREPRNLGLVSDLVLEADCSRTDLVQDVHAFLGHSICKVIECEVKP